MADTAKHTDGPWFVSRKHEVGPRSKAEDQSNGMIIPLCDVYGDNRNQDALLIAAAPDLLKVLKRISSAVDFNGTCHPLFSGLQKQMQDAIAKAEGV